MVVVLPAFWTMGQLGQWWDPPLAAVVVAVMLGVSLPRAVAAVDRAHWPGACAGLLVATVVATVARAWVAAGDGWEAAGAVVFAALAALTAWLRRFGAAWRTVGLVAGLPLVAVLVAPVPSALSWGLVGWVAVGATAAAVWALATAWLGAPVETVGSGSPSVPAGRRLFSSTRMSLQLAAAVGLAFVAAQLVDATHLVWPVLTAFLVLNNNRGRGDVLWKGAQRLVGAAAGTAAATVVVGWWPAGDSRAVVAVFVLLAVGSAVRTFGYAYWAACVTAGLAFFYGYLDQGGVSVLAQRLAGIGIGGAVAIAVAWFLLPVRTTDVVRARIGAVRRAAAAQQKPTAQLREARRQLTQMLPTVRAARMLGIGSVRTLADTVEQTLERTRAPATDPATPTDVRISPDGADR